MSLSIKNLSFSYEDKIILKNINLSCKSGEITVIAGNNGSGKTTLIKNIIAEVRVKKSSIFINDIDIINFSINEKSRLMSYVPQNSSKEFDFTVYEVVEMGRYPYKKEWNSENDKKYIVDSLKITNTYELKDRSISTLSGGELQRVILARALAGTPKYLILDEPSSNLDISHNIEIMNLIKKITKKFNITTVIVLHDLNTILHFADSVALIKNGEIYAQGQPSEVLTHNNINFVFNVKIQILQDDSGQHHIVLH